MKKNTSMPNLGLVIGILGLIAGIALMFSESWLIGVFGSMASAGIAYKGYRDSRALTNRNS